MRKQMITGSIKFHRLWHIQKTLAEPAPSQEQKEKVAWQQCPLRVLSVVLSHVLLSALGFV